MNKYRLRLEAVNLAAFIDDTNLLSTVRGGGLLLLGATAQVQARYPALEPVTTGASAGVFEFDAPDDSAAARMRDDVDDALRQDDALRHATFVVDVVPASDYADNREELLALNRWRQWRRPTLAFPSTLDDKRWPCHVDGVRPAGAGLVPRRSDHRPWPASVSVHQRWTYGKDQKQAFYRTHAGVEALFTNDFDELSGDPERGDLDGKMAVIYVDGNSFGDVQRRHCASVDTQREWDHYIKEQRRQWLRAFLEQAQADGPGFHTKQRALRIETLLWGGDELMLVVPAWRGWWTLASFFEHGAGWQVFGERLTHAAGLVFCHYKAPIRRVKALARELAETVKAEGGRDENRFAYLVLESFDHVGRDLEGFLVRRWPRLTEWILAGESMQELANQVRALEAAEFPRSKLYAIAKAIAADGGTSERGRAQAQRWIDQAVQSHPASQQAVHRLLTLIRGEHDSAVTWLHVAELWDYLTAD